MNLNITDEELEIFSRQLILKDFNNKKFNELQKKEISIIGLGGIGCPLAQYLISSGIKKLNIFDNDIIKKSNLNRQTLYSFNELGKKKSIIARKKLLGINPNACINSYNQKITKKNLNLLKNSSMIIDCNLCLCRGNNFTQCLDIMKNLFGFLFFLRYFQMDKN